MAISFDPAGSHNIFIPNPIGPLDVAGSQLVISAWINPDIVSGAARMIVAKSGGTSPSTQYELRVSSTGKLEFLVGTSAGIQSAVGATTLSTGAWTHALGNKVGNGGGSNIGVWVNGSLDGLGSTSNNIQDTGQNFRIAGRDDGLFWDGKIAEVALWNVNLSGTEIGALAKGMSPLMIRPANLIGYFPLWGNGSTEPNLANWGANQVGSAASSGSKADHAPVRPPFPL